MAIITMGTRMPMTTAMPMGTITDTTIIIHMPIPIAGQMRKPGWLKWNRMCSGKTI
jgi:hypothetical protein